MELCRRDRWVEGLHLDTELAGVFILQLLHMASHTIPQTQSHTTRASANSVTDELRASEPAQSPSHPPGWTKWRHWLRHTLGPSQPSRQMSNLAKSTGVCPHTPRMELRRGRHRFENI